MKGADKRGLTVGVISDTHGLLRPEALAALRGSDYIIHAGDVGAPELLAPLAAIAPVTAVRGNVDRGNWAAKLPLRDVLEIGSVFIYVLHDIAEFDLDARAGKFAAVVYGHSHIPKQEIRDGVLYFNPGSAGPRRFTLPVTVGRIRVQSGSVAAEILTLEVAR